jgi:hypothetical protein
MRMELPRAYFLDKNCPDATLQLELVKGGNLPPEVLANVVAFLNPIRRQKNWIFNFGMSPVLDSNINQASSGRGEKRFVSCNLIQPTSRSSSMKTFVHKTLIAAAVFACFSQPVLADGAGISPANVGVSAELGTTGVGVHASIPVFRTLNARFGVNYFNYNTTGNTSDVDYKFKLKLNTIDALADWHPLENGFRLTAGVLWNGNKVDAKAKANKSGQYEINGNFYDAVDAGDLKGRISFNDVAPYLGIGWGNAPNKKGWAFSGDLGVIFQGSPSVSLKNSNCKLGPGNCDQLNDDLQVERKKLKDEVKDFQYYPVIRFGVGYRF